MTIFNFATNNHAVSSDLIVSTQKLSTIEFFSGIGGYAFAIKARNLPLNITKSYDINTRANHVYAHNHSHSPITTGIDRLQAKDVTADVWVMSPPCQPFTSGGLRKDDKDPRSDALLNLITLLPDIKPKIVFVENVFNFEKSKSRELLVGCLAGLGYSIKEVMVSPIQIGIPNDRKRYYLAAYLSDCSNPQEYPLDGSNLIRSISDYIPGYITPPLEPISNYISLLDSLDEELLVDPKNIHKRTNFKFDVVNPSSPSTSTFTKAYGSHHFFGSGSILVQGEYNHEGNDRLVELKPRYFSPEEVGKLMGMNIKWPKDVTLRQKYKLLGNGVSVDVVGLLLERLVRDAGY